MRVYEREREKGLKIREGREGKGRRKWAGEGREKEDCAFWLGLIAVLFGSGEQFIWKGLASLGKGKWMRSSDRGLAMRVRRKYSRA